MGRRAASVLAFYRDGFRSMTLGRTLWVVVLVKAFVLFAVLRPLLFPDVLADRYATDPERADHVLRHLVAAPADAGHHDAGDPDD